MIVRYQLNKSNMTKNIWIYFMVNIICVSVTDSLQIFHEGSKMTYRPESGAEFFGYCVVLSPNGLVIGAPKAARLENPTLKPGAVFNCSIHELGVKEVRCQLMAPTSRKRGTWFGRTIHNDFFKDDMWFGASIVSLSNGKLLVNSPRWTTPYGENHLLANGASYLRTQKRDGILYIFNEDRKVAYVVDGKRLEYGEFGTHVSFYAYGQAGMSAKVTENNTFILGAPGLLQWTGGIVSFTYEPDENSMYVKKQVIANPYFTRDIGPDDYFGYAVESGIFDKSRQVLYVGGAPRSKMGYGQVLVFVPPVREQQALNVLAKIQGPQMGSYFGSSLCCTDLNGDGFDDLLVGAPTYAKKDGGLPYDQGAVFVYLTQQESTKFVLKASGYVAGSKLDGSRFGTTIADLGDIDGDGFTDVAISAPWENGRGVVYIYRGSSGGLKNEYVQRIESHDAKGFGISISKGLDIDHNNISDLAVGAHASERVYLYRSVPTMRVSASIRVPDAMNLPQNATGFTALFCVAASPRKSWPHVQMHLTGRIIVDPEDNRANITSDANRRFQVKPSQESCEHLNVTVSPTADLSKPISLLFELTPVELMKDNDPTFMTEAVRLSDDSNLKATFLIQLVRDCGDDMVCTPWLVMNLEPLDNPYIPGTATKLGVRVIISNKEEPAYGAIVNIVLPFQPKRVPSECSLLGLNITCDVPSPLNRYEDVVWEIEMEYHTNNTNDMTYNVTAILSDSLYRNVTKDAFKKLLINVSPEAHFNVSGKSLPNATLLITRDKFNEGENLTFKHYFEIINHGPSDWSLMTEFLLPEKVNLSNKVMGCKNETGKLLCEWFVQAKLSLSIVIPLRLDLSKHGKFLELNSTYNVTTKTVLHLKHNITVREVTTRLILEPAKVVWPIILGSAIMGLLLLSLITYSFKRFGFFMRRKRDDMKNLLNAESEEKQSSSEGVSAAYESTTELVEGDGDSQ